MAKRWKRQSLEALAEEADAGMRGQGALLELIRRTARSNSGLTVAILFLTGVITILTAMMVFPELANWFRSLFGVPPLDP